jgi:hypothetical protein
VSAIANMWLSLAPTDRCVSALLGALVLLTLHKAVAAAVQS